MVWKQSRDWSGLIRARHEVTSWPRGKALMNSEQEV